MLKQKYDNIVTFVSDKNRHGGNGFGFQHDLGYLVGCVNYVPCQSSLCPLIIQLSKSIKNVYMPSYMLKTTGHHAIREHPIWWSQTLTNKKCDTNKDITFAIPIMTSILIHQMIYFSIRIRKIVIFYEVFSKLYSPTSLFLK